MNTIKLFNPWDILYNLFNKFMFCFGFDLIIYWWWIIEECQFRYRPAVRAKPENYSKNDDNEINEIMEIKLRIFSTKFIFHIWIKHKSGAVKRDWNRYTIVDEGTSDKNAVIIIIVIITGYWWVVTWAVTWAEFRHLPRSRPLREFSRTAALVTLERFSHFFVTVKKTRG